MRASSFRLLLPLFVGAALAVLPAHGQDETEETTAEGGSISGQIFEDDNENGIREADEIGGAGIIVDLLDSEGEFIARVISDENGLYSFQGLEDGTYFLRFEFSPGFGIRSRGIEVEGGATVFSPVPVITPNSQYNFVRLNLMNPAAFKGDEVSPFKP